MTLILSIILVILSALVGYHWGRRANQIDQGTFEAQARIIRDLSRQLSETKPDAERYEADY